MIIIFFIKINNFFFKLLKGNFLSNFNELLSTNDWASINEFTSFKSENNTESIKLPSLLNIIETRVEINNDNDLKREKQDETYISVKQMFPTIKENIIKELLEQYDNDINTVTNILLDSINLDDLEVKNEITVNNENENTTVKSLKELCNITLDKFEILLEKYYETSKKNEFDVDEFKEENQKKINQAQSNCLSLMTSELELKIENIPKPYFENLNQSIDNDDDPILDLKLDKNFLKSLIQLFGDDNDMNLLKSNILK